MKKMIKMSLVAAVAVAGFSTSASAANLEDAIKGTTVKGYVRYRLKTDHENSTDTNEKAKIVAKLTTPVNDMVTANVKMQAGETSTQNKDTAATMKITEGNFVIKAGGATVIAGLQTSQSPFFANNGDTRSHGFTALVPVGPVTLAGAYYMTTTGGGLASPVMTNDVAAIGALGNFGPVGVKAWYAAVEDGKDLDNGGSSATTLNTLSSAFDDASAYSLDLTVKAGPANVQLMTTQVSNGDSDTGVSKLVATAEVGTVSGMVAFAQSNKDGGTSSLDQDSDSISDLGLDNLNMQATTDATAFAIGGKIKATPQVWASVDYLNGADDISTGSKKDFNELDLKAGYNLSKNFKSSILYATGDAMGTDFGYSQIELKYTF